MAPRLPARFKVPLLVVVIAGCWFFTFRQIHERRVPVPEDAFQCENGHAWTARVSADPTCPECSAAGASESSYRCPGCAKTFVGLTVRREGVGKFSYRLPGESEWLVEAPSHLTCPHCRHRAEGRFFPGLGFGGKSSTDDPVID